MPLYYCLENDIEGAENMSENGKDKIRGIRIRTVSYTMIFLSIVLYLVLLYATRQVSNEYEVVVAATDDYIMCDAQAAQLAQGSNYLTEQIQLYVVTAKPEYVHNYFEEVNVAKRREHALKELEQYNVHPETHRFLEEALARSNQLMEREIYAIKLTALAQGADLQEFSETVQKTVLKREDENLTPEEMQEKARQMIFGIGYQEAKALIMSSIDYFVNDAVSNTYKNQQSSFSTLNETIIWSKVCLSILFLLNLITFAMIILLIIKPLQLYINCIKDEKRLEIIGSYEFKYLALTYNDIYEVKASHEAMLRRKAEHDALTGLINRGAFEQMKQLFTANPVPLILLVIDVDKFKFINDGFGHEVGDRILKKVADALKNSFRSGDYPARIGGDEFAVIVIDVNESEKDVIQRKMEKINRMLMNPADGLPPVSLSVGGAFSKRGFVDDLYACADRALYAVKENGRCGCRFYEDLDERKNTAQ